MNMSVLFEDVVTRSTRQDTVISESNISYISIQIEMRQTGERYLQGPCSGFPWEICDKAADNGIDGDTFVELV